MENKLIKYKSESGEIISERIKVANNMFSRMKGLMFTEFMEGYDALLIKPCNSIHTFFMLMNIDVVFLDEKNLVVKIIYDLAPWRMTRIYFKSNKVLEMKAGTLNKNLKIGEVLREYV